MAKVCRIQRSYPLHRQGDTGVDSWRTRFVCIPAELVLANKNKHLVGKPGYAPKWKARLVACGNFEQMDGEDVRDDSPTAEQAVVGPYP